MDFKRNGVWVSSIAIFALCVALMGTAEAICGGNFHTDEGILHSPHYPRQYGPNEICIWKITVPENHQVALSFQSFDLEYQDHCNYDYLDIYDGPEMTSTMLGRFCGTQIPEKILSSDNKMTVKFISDPGTHRNGFSAFFIKVGPTGTHAKDKESVKNLTQFFLNIRQTGHLINKWGRNLSRAAMSLYLADQEFFHASNQTGQEIAYEISLQLLSKLSLKKKMGTHELSLYVNSLLVSCIDPRDFFGINVVAELRKRVDNSNYTNPFTILTLCNARDEHITTNDVSKVLAVFDTQHRRLWTDNQAMATMALACLATRPNITVEEDDLSRMLADLKRKQHKNGIVDNLATTALVVQALLATDSYLDDFDYKGAMEFISQQVRNGSLSIMDAFYVLPVLSGKSLLNICNDHCQTPSKTDPAVLVDLLNIQDERIQVQYSVFIGDDMDFIRTWKVKVPANSTFYDVLEKISSMEPEYRVRYTVIESKPYVSGLTKIVDHAERDMYWFIYKQTLGSREEPKIIKRSPVDIQVNEEEELILWYRSGTWITK